MQRACLPYISPIKSLFTARPCKCKVKALGVWFSNDPEATATLNYNEKLDKVRNVLSCWKYRRLTLVGKITVLKSLVASQLVYVLSPLHTNVKIIKEVNKLFFSFLWNKALKIFSHEYDSKLNRSVHVPLTDSSLAPNISKKKG